MSYAIEYEFVMNKQYVSRHNIKFSEPGYKNVAS